MELIKSLLDILLHLDEHLGAWVVQYGTFIYIILFLIIFVETGLVIMPLLPGDSLLFAVGALAAQNSALNIWFVMPLLFCAALLGDNVNYFVGKFFGDTIKSRERILFFKREYITKTEEFYAKNGGKTIIMARFVPIVRTFAPFVAGAGSMNYRTYIVNCVIGALLWVFGITLLGYFFGNIPIIKDNFEIVVLGIIGLSVLPILIGLFKKEK
jgi:membrane-associated protein